MTVQEEIRRMWLQSAKGLYGSEREALEALDRVNAIIDRRAREERAAAAAAREKRRAYRKSLAYRGAQTVASTCSVCGTQHPGEC